MNTRVKWTKEEDEILVRSILDNPQNKRAAFKEVAIKTDHNISSCSSRWYNTLNNPENKHYVGCMFTLIGHKSKFDTIKNTPIIRYTIWDKIKNFIINLYKK